MFSELRYSLSATRVESPELVSSVELILEHACYRGIVLRSGILGVANGRFENRELLWHCIGGA